MRRGDEGGDATGVAPTEEEEGRQGASHGYGDARNPRKECRALQSERERGVLKTKVFLRFFLNPKP